MLADAGCNEPCTLFGEVLRRGRLGSATNELAAAGKARLKIKLRRKARRKLRKRKKVKVTVRLTGTDAVGNAEVVSKKLTLRRKRRKP